MSNRMFTVIVMTFNQENVVEDALNSLLFQDHEPTELLICDDASTDGTVDVCEKWLAANGARFHDTRLVRNSLNLGIVKNYAKAVSLSRGDFIARLCGDDMLAPRALANAAHHLEASGAEAVFGNVTEFEWRNGEFLVSSVRPGSHVIPLFSLSALEQFRILSVVCCVPAPGAFFSKSFFEKVQLDSFDVLHLDDWAMWLKSTSMGAALRYRPFEAAFFRRHRGKHKNQTFESLCSRDIIRITDTLIRPGVAKLSFLEKSAVFLNRARHFAMVNQHTVRARLYEPGFNILRSFIRLRLLPKSGARRLFFSRTQGSTKGKPLSTPFPLKKP